MFLQKYISVEDIEYPKASKVSKASKARSTVPRQSTCCSGSNGLVYIAEVWTPTQCGKGRQILGQSQSEDRVVAIRKYVRSIRMYIIYGDKYEYVHM
jgi:hypothetical protein